MNRQSSPNRDRLTAGLTTGWNTLYTRSVLSHVFMPAGICLSLGLKEYANGQFLGEALIGRQGQQDETVVAGPRTWDDTYTEVTVGWRGIRIRVESMTLSPDGGALFAGSDNDGSGNTLVLAVTPLESYPNAKVPKIPLLSAHLSLLWNRSGEVLGPMEVRSPAATVRLTSLAPGADDPYLPVAGPYSSYALDGPIVLVATTSPQASGSAPDAGVAPTTEAISTEKITELLAARRAETLAAGKQYGNLADSYHAVHRVLAWDTIYDPGNDRVISPVSRIWNNGNGGYVLFDWDTYFAALLAAVDNEDVAFSDAIAITEEITERGFIPNVAAANGFVSRDRSQPPVGSMTVLWLYQRFGKRWFPEYLFDRLLRWNRWWEEKREHRGYLCWGSNPYEPVTGNSWETNGVGGRFGGALESGLDNSPMYDDIPFNEERGVLELGDVGLMGLYVADCEALAIIARELGRDADAEEIAGRGRRFADALRGMWNDEVGLFLNVRTDATADAASGATAAAGDRRFEYRLSPTHFYPLLGGVATQEQAERMIAEHLFNPEEFWGEWVLPSIARNDPAYSDQNYWRGRIWAPMNFLVYMGLCRYDLPEARAKVAEKSVALLMKEWQANGYVCENYNGDTGSGSDRPNSDRFYHWGALLGLIGLIEGGHYSPLQFEA